LRKQAEKFQGEQKEKLLDLVDDYTLAGSNLTKIKIAVNEFVRLYQDFGGSKDEFDNDFLEYKKSGGKKMAVFVQVGKAAMASGKSISELKTIIRR